MTFVRVVVEVLRGYVYDLGKAFRLLRYLLQALSHQCETFELLDDVCGLVVLCRRAIAGGVW